MENKINETYFWGRLKIAGILNVNSSAQGIANKNKTTEIQRYISKYQKEYLLYLLGVKVYEDVPNEIMELIIDEASAISPMANYIFCKYQIDTATFPTPSGQKKLTVNNTQEEDIRPTIAAAWNEMVDMNQIIHQKLYKAKKLGGVDYVNDIMNEIEIAGVGFLHRNTTTIQLSGGIFSKKSMYEINK